MWEKGNGDEDSSRSLKRETLRENGTVVVERFYKDGTTKKEKIRERKTSFCYRIFHLNKKMAFPKRKRHFFVDKSFSLCYNISTKETIYEFGVNSSGSFLFIKWKEEL